ncbi:MAG: type II toxin-antitoxin system VapC family toxin [Pseudomonadota bacterium]|nr:type II toxin-antitoxin system VapC family toxin [Pseudomonadota bacterium]
MKITADTNVLARLVMDDDTRQATRAARALEAASLVAVPVHALCELCWVLERGYGVTKAEVADAVQDVLNIAKVQTDRPAAQAGLALLRVGGDFADGVMAYGGRFLGAETFVSFDRKAVKLLNKLGEPAQLVD